VPYPPYVTPVEQTTAREMGKIAKQMGADFVLALGDNFYYTGVDSVDSPRFNVSRRILFSFFA
jgi:tartrate-resistant acid phosphatase type 5